MKVRLLLVVLGLLVAGPIAVADAEANARVRWEEGKLLRAEDKNEAAMKAFLDALTVLPKEPHLQLDCAWCAFALRRMEEAKKHVDSVLAVKGEFRKSAAYRSAARLAARLNKVRKDEAKRAAKPAKERSRQEDKAVEKLITMGGPTEFGLDFTIKHMFAPRSAASVAPGSEVTHVLKGAAAKLIEGAATVKDNRCTIDLVAVCRDYRQAVKWAEACAKANWHRVRGRHNQKEYASKRSRAWSRWRFADKRMERQRDWYRATHLGKTYLTVTVTQTVAGRKEKPLRTEGTFRVEVRLRGPHEVECDDSGGFMEIDFDDDD